MESTGIRAIAFVLPQFHPVPENDEWWGRGFTEWTNVAKAKSLFKGHYQPRLPADLGFYDLRLPEARKAQAELAKEYGIFGFCYYHYWFNGKRLLNLPIDEMLRLKEPDMPFMLCWANENWTRKWDGKDEEILIKQEYNSEDDKKHIHWLCEKVFSDPRYIRINNRPVFMIYRYDLIPDILETVRLWRTIAREEFGFEDLYLIVSESFGKSIDPENIDFDASVEFSPHQVIRKEIEATLTENLLQSIKLKKRKSYSLRDFKWGVARSKSRIMPNYKLFRCVTPSWDNSPRRMEGASIALGSSPEVYYDWLRYLISKFQPYSEEENFVFINAMNEWAEGNHLEPCNKYGRKFLEATKRALHNGKE